MDLLEPKYIVNNYLNAPKFTGRNVPMAEIAAATGKSVEYLREGLKRGIFTFGYSMESHTGRSHSFFCPDKLVWEKLGYFNEDI